MRFVCSLHLRRGTFNHPLRVAPPRDSKLQTLSATVVLKSPDEGGVDESLPSQIRGLLFARCAQMPEKRPAAF
jgi:hypothetical protein